MWPFGKRRQRDRRPGRIAKLIRARFNAAVTNTENARHWANADALSADAAANPDVRRTLRNRARYEIANNSYARGIVLTLANDVVGTGPRLQMLTSSDQVNRAVEREFDSWARQVGLAEKLRTMRMARAQDGEAFAVLVNNPVLDYEVKLDLRLIEADQITSPTLSLLNKNQVGRELQDLRAQALLIDGNHGSHMSSILS